MALNSPMARISNSGMGDMMTRFLAHGAVEPEARGPACADRASLVIGYGNTLRGDDGAGPRVADVVAAWRRQGVRALAVQQLTPELAEALAAARLAIFVDAAPAAGVQVKVQSLKAVDSDVALGHVSDPPYLLALARALYGWSPAAWWVLVPGVCFEMGERLSGVAARGVEAALRQIAALIDSRDHPCTKSD
jgi:hydrogenase maturation protease